MSDLTGEPTMKLSVNAGLDRGLASTHGGSVRYIVVDVSAEGNVGQDSAMQAINLALAIDVSGSMRGDRIAAARRTAIAIVAALTERDRLSLVAFNDTAVSILAPSIMDEGGRAAAQSSIGELVARGATNLFEGWMLAAEAVARAMYIDGRRSGRVVLLSDGHANQGLIGAQEITRHVGALLDRGVVTTAIGIGGGYDQRLLGGIAESGGGGLHDADTAEEIQEVVLGELREGRGTVVERLRISLEIPAGFSAEVLGAWGNTINGTTLEVLCGGLQFSQTRRIVIRLVCPAGEVGSRVPLTIRASGTAIAIDASLDAATEVSLGFAGRMENKTQQPDAGRSIVVARAWQYDIVRRAMELVATESSRAAEGYLGTERPRFEAYAQSVPGGDVLVEDLLLLWQRIGDGVDSRTSKSLYLSSYKGSRAERDLRRHAGPTLRQYLSDRDPPAS